MGDLLAAPKVPSFVLSNPSTSTEQAIAGTTGQSGSTASDQTTSTNTTDATASSNSTDASSADNTQNTADSGSDTSNLLLRQSRGTNATVLTSLRGLLEQEETLGAKKTLLGQ